MMPENGSEHEVRETQIPLAYLVGSCHGCRRLRYQPQEGASLTMDLPAWSAPGRYICEKRGLVGPASIVPMQKTDTCKESR